jgi:hypothetical protein
MIDKLQPPIQPRKIVIMSVPRDCICRTRRRVSRVNHMQYRAMHMRGKSRGSPDLKDLLQLLALHMSLPS